MTLLEQAHEALKLARDTFSRYEDLHREKCTDDGNKKANANAALSLRMEEGLAALKQLSAAPPLEGAQAGEDMVERVARAIYETRFKSMNIRPLNSEDKNTNAYSRLLDQARAAIAAMRGEVEGAKQFWKSVEQFSPLTMPVSRSEDMVERVTKAVYPFPNCTVQDARNIARAAIAAMRGEVEGAALKAKGAGDE